MLPKLDPAETGLIPNLFDFMPELAICLGIVLLLVLRLFRAFDRSHLGFMALLVTLAALGISVLQWLGDVSGESQLAGFLRTVALRPPSTSRPSLMFGGLLLYDYMTVFARIFLYTFTALVIWLSLLTGIPDREDSADFYTLLLGATLGMVLMASSSHLLMVFIAIEMASLPSYALAGFLKGRRQSSEAALKYVVYGGGAAGIMLYGISLLAGKFGTGFMPDLAAGVLASFVPSPAGAFDPVVVLGILFLLIGIAFKLAAFPFHFWCPDVFEGASAEVAGFLSVASKGAALAMLARITLFFTGLDPLIDQPLRIPDLPYFTVIRYLVPALALVAALTATFGNMAAYQQTNLKRLLAYSTIAHAGYMLMALCTLTRGGVEAMLFYLVAYFFMNLGAFAVVAFLRNQTRSEDLADFRGLIRRSPLMVVTLSLFLLSLLGIPPLVGFAAKFQIFAVLYEDGRRYSAAGQPGLGATLIALLIVGGLNTVLSAFYYLKVMKVMILDQRAEDLEGTDSTPLRQPIGAMLYAGLMALMVLVLGILWDPVTVWSRQSVARFRLEPGKDVTQAVVATVDPMAAAPGVGGGGGRRPNQPKK